MTVKESEFDENISLHSTGNKGRHATHPDIVIHIKSQKIIQDLEKKIARQGYTLIQARDQSTLYKEITENKVEMVIVEASNDEEWEALIADIKRQHPHIIIVCIVSREIKDDAYHAITLGVFEILAYPFDELEIFAMLNRLDRHLEIICNNTSLTHQLAEKTVELSDIKNSFDKIVKLSKALIDSTNSSQMGQTFLKTIAQNMSAEGGSLFLKKDDRLVCAYSMDINHVPESILLPLKENSVFGIAMKKGRPVFIDNINENTGIIQSGWEGYKDGSSVIFPLQDETGDVVALISLHNKVPPPFIARDIDLGQILISQAYKRLCLSHALETLRENEEKYRLIAENVSDVIWTMDLDMQFTYISPSSERLLGYVAEDLLGKGAKDVLAYSSFEVAVKALADDLIQNSQGEKGLHSSRVLDLKMVCKDGKNIWTEARISFIRDEDNTPLGIMGISRDISVRLNLESQLRHAQKMEAVGTLAGGIAHDFNNLLQAIQGYSELLIHHKKETDPDYRKLKEIVHTARRAGELTQQLLTFSRKVESKMRPVRLNRELEQVVKLLRRTIPKMISINLKVEKNLRIINADPMQIEQILINLAVNAKDAMPDGGRLDIQTKNIVLDGHFCESYPGLEPGEYVLLTVADSGCGMTNETRERIFDPFFTTKISGEGTGLGLSMVYGIVKSHNSLILCASKKDKGSTFDIYFPAIDHHNEWNEITNEEFPPKGGDETILLVDDEIVIRNLCELVLSKLGYNVLKASDGETAIKIFQERKIDIDLVILDIIMPGMGGEKCLKELLKCKPDLKVLIASGFTGKVSTGSLLETGIKGFIHKPFEMNYLVSTVRDVLDIKQ
ncbi:MAG: response regulator [Proteobacteria bacterium]|nr:response regulator [Pseudomonadota bacterium]